ncbi:hypothetical protein N7456_009077 [Penicillium angulare]|uniref:Aminoglycoside phosphotransferase domain-containing protein n=1 Tax=Penicillium angulare TaxID=116970 RepID=A0A9W9F441_9EURO|nr:hypothetical protein N7456_009077 [Penicillium angulare]
MDTTKEYETTVIHALFDRRVVRISETLVVKSGGNLRTHEGPTLRFIKENTTIPVPDVHDIRWKDGKVVELVMDYMPGKPLDQAWQSLTHDQKVSICNQLHFYIAQLRNLKGKYIGAVDNSKAIIGKRIPKEGGPFDSEKQFNEFILGHMIKIPDLLRHYTSFSVTEGHDIVFTHSDLAPRNILVEGDKVTAILDWEYGGWYPEYWEYIRALMILKPMPDWPEYLPIILPPRYEKEYIGMSFLGMLSSH